MPALAWKDEYAIGVHRYDQAHKRLVGLISDLHEAMIQGKGNDALLKIFDELTDYTVKHFADEEAMFELHGYPHAERHAEIHANLVKQVQARRAEVEANAPGMANKTLTFLKKWLMSHILKHDKAYAPFLNSKGVK